MLPCCTVRDVHWCLQVHCVMGMIAACARHAYLVLGMPRVGVMGWPEAGQLLGGPGERRCPSAHVAGLVLIILVPKYGVSYITTQFPSSLARYVLGQVLLLALLVPWLVAASQPQNLMHSSESSHITNLSFLASIHPCVLGSCWEAWWAPFCRHCD